MRPERVGNTPLEFAGLTASDIANIKLGPDAPGISGNDAALLQAADELVRDHFISEPTWSKLAARFTQDQLMDLVFAVGHYTMISMALNSFGVQLEDGYD